MTDIVTPVEPVASAPTPPAEPVQAPVEAIILTTEPIITPTVEAPVAPVEAPKPPETLLAAPDIAPVVPVEAPVAPVVPEAQLTKEGQSDEPAPPSEVAPTPVVAPVYEPFVAPEGVTLDQERIGKFTELLAGLETEGKLDHTLAQQFGQKAVDFHINEVKKAAEEVTKLYQTTWDRQKIEWKESFLKDPEIGGNRFQTTVDAAKTFIRTHGGTPEQQADFRNLMETSGLGNHPTMIRILAKAGMAMSEGKPLAASKPVQAQKSKTETLYGR